MSAPLCLHDHLTHHILSTLTPSALTGKVDKEKQKRDQEIVNAARENNIFNLSLPSHIPGPKNAMSLRCVVCSSLHIGHS